MSDLTYQQAKRAIELFEQEWIGQDSKKLWGWCVDVVKLTDKISVWDNCKIYVAGKQVQ